MTELPPPPGPSAEQAEALSPSFFTDPVTVFSDLTKQYGPVFQFPLGGISTVFVNDAASAEKVLRLDFESFAMSSQSEELNRPLLGRSMPVVADHLYWEQLHAIMLPLFTPKMLRGYFEKTVQAVAEEVDHLAALYERGEQVNMLSFVREGIFVALSRTLFVRGVEPEHVRQLLDWFALSNKYMGLRYLVGEAADTDARPEIAAGREGLAKIDRYVRDLIAFRRANPAPEPEDMLDVLVTAKKSDGELLSDTEIRDNVVALFFGGQETTPTVTTWAFGLLSAHPEKREKVLEEVDRVLGGRRPEFQDLAKLEYTEAVLDEALRLYPPFSFVGREALKDVELGGYAVRAGTPIGFVGWTIHREEQHWPNPLAFKPERHSKEMKAQRPKCSFVAFGYGKRRCTGERVGRMEAMLLLSMISQKFLMNRVGGGMSPHLVMQSIKPADGLPMEIEPRKT